MMKLSIQMSDFGKLAALLRVVKPAGRRRLYEVGTYAAGNLVRRHLKAIGMQRHNTASRLGAKPTGHFDVSRHPVTSRVEGDDGLIEIAIPGISRARRDLTISPVRSRLLTIPKHAAAYGHTVETLRRRGWKIFRPGKKKVLRGYRNKGEEPVILFALADSAHQKHDPSLLPTDADMGRTAAEAMTKEIRRVMSAAKGAR